MTAVPGRLAVAWRSGPLAVRSFRLLAGGQFASTIGDFCYAVALPWLVLSAHGGAILLGIVLACYGVPRTVLIPVGGVLADKVGPRTLMLAADAARCVLVAGLALLAARHTASLAALGPIAALIGPARGCSSRRRSRSCRHCSTRSGSRPGTRCPPRPCRPGRCSARPSAASWWPPPGASTAAFAVDAASFGVSALTLLLIPRQAARGSMAAVAAEAAAVGGAASGAGDAAGADGASPARAACWRC